MLGGFKFAIETKMTILIGYRTTCHLALKKFVRWKVLPTVLPASIKMPNICILLFICWSAV